MKKKWIVAFCLGFIAISAILLSACYQELDGEEIIYIYSDCCCDDDNGLDGDSVKPLPSDTTIGEEIIYIYTDCCCCDNNDLDGNSVKPLPGSVTIVILADQSVGRDGWLTIYRITDYGEEMVADIPILIGNGSQFGFDLEPGNYWVTATGLAFTSYAEFTVTEGQNNVIALEMYEWPLITWYASLHPQSPSGMSAPALNVEIMRFTLIHDWYEGVIPGHFTFNLNYSPNVTIDNCYLYRQNPNTGDFINIGTAMLDSGVIYFGADAGNLSDTAIYTSSWTSYRLNCDIWASANDTLRASLADFKGQPLTTNQQVLTLPLYGNVLLF